MKKLLHLGKSISWVFLTTFFGLLQIWILLISSLFKNGNLSYFHNIIIDGGLLFFITGMVSSISIDYFHSNTRLKQAQEAAIFVLLPVIILLFVVIIFIVGLKDAEASMGYYSVKNIQLLAITFTLIYSIVAKAILFHLSKK